MTDLSRRYLARHLQRVPECRTNSTRMTVGSVRYNAARKALAAEHRVDEVKHIHDKATALLAYAKQAGDYELQNNAAEIRLKSSQWINLLAAFSLISSENVPYEMSGGGGVRSVGIGIPWLMVG